MKNESVIEILNELLTCESQSLLPRLGEAIIFVCWASADQQRAVSTMIDQGTEHRAWLVEAIRDLGGDPLPAGADIQSTNVHFLDLSFVLPRTTEDRKRLLALYESATAQVGAHALAGSVIARITERLGRHVEQLTDLMKKAVAPSF